MDAKKNKRLSKLYRAGLAVGLLLALAGCPDSNRGSMENLSYLNDVERKVYQQINDYRDSHSLAPFAVDERIVNQARGHSQAMADGTEPLGHQGFDQRVAETGINPIDASENVAYNEGYSDPAAAAVEGWLASTGHRKNIEGDFNLTGIGVVKNTEGTYYFTQIFMRQ